MLAKASTIDKHMTKELMKNNATYATLCNMQLIKLYATLCNMQLTQLMQLYGTYATLCNNATYGTMQLYATYATICDFVGTTNVYWHDNKSLHQQPTTPPHLVVYYNSLSEYASWILQFTFPLCYGKYMTMLHLSIII